jgi:hypothetical protein
MPTTRCSACNATITYDGGRAGTPGHCAACGAWQLLPKPARPRLSLLGPLVLVLFCGPVLFSLFTGVGRPRPTRGAGTGASRRAVSRRDTAPSGEDAGTGGGGRRT